MTKASFHIILATIVILSFSCKNRQQTAKAERSAKTIQKHEKSQFEKTYMDALRQKITGKNEEAIKLFEKALNINKSDASVYFHLSELYFATSRYDKSLEYARKAWEMDETNLYFGEHYAKLLQVNYNTPEANNIYNKLIEKFPNDKRLYNNALIMNKKSGNYSKCVEFLQKMENNLGPSRWSTKELFELYVIRNDSNSVNLIMNRINTTYPDLWEYNLKAATYFKANNNPTRNAFYLSIAGELHPESYDVLKENLLRLRTKHSSIEYLQALQLLVSNKNITVEEKKHETDYLIQHFKTDTSGAYLSKEIVKTFVAVHPTESESYLTAGSLYYLLGDFENARGYYVKALRLEPSFPEVWKDLLLCDEKIGNNVFLRQDAEDALGYFPTLIPFYEFKIKSLKTEGNYKLAIETCKTALSYTVLPIDAARIQQVTGELYLLDSDAESATNHFLESLKNHSSNPNALKGLALCYTIRNIKTEEATKLIANSEEQLKDDFDVLFVKAWNLIRSGDIATSEKLMKELETVGWIKNFYFWEALGDLYALKGDKTNAIINWKKSVLEGNKSAALLNKINS